MKNAFAIVTLLAVLSACATAPRVPTASAGAAPGAAPPLVANTDPAAEDIAEDAAPHGPADALPAVELSSDLLYKLTKAELEFKVGQWQGPYMTLMGAATQTRDPRLAQRAAEMALTARQGGEALAAIRLWRELAPNSEEASQYFLGFIVLGDQMEEAEPIFTQRIRDAAPAARGMAIFRMQQVLTRAKDKVAAFAMLERVLAPYGAALETHLVLAQGAFAMGDGRRATQEAQQSMLIQPDSELAMLTLAQVTPDGQTVDRLLTAFLAQHPGARQVRLAYARTLLDHKQYEPARQQFLILLKGQPENVATLYALGIVSVQLNDAALAETYFKQFLTVLAAHPDDQHDASKVLMMLSQLAEERGDVDGAMQWLDQVDESERHPYVEAKIRRAQLLARHGDLSRARTSLAELNAEDNDEKVQILLADAQLLRDSGDDQGAFGVLKNGVKRFPDRPELLYDFALSAEKTGRFELMETSLQSVIAQSPDNQHAYNALGYSLAERNIRLPEAHALIDKALSMAPNDPFIMDSMGWVQFRLGHLQEAEEVLRRAYALRSDAEIAVHLGEVLWARGDQAGAQTVWREVEAKDPKNAALKSTLARLKLSL